jgi:hypothetical protein
MLPHEREELTIPKIDDLFSSQTAFDPETVTLLSEALENAWKRVQASGAKLARPAYARATREVMAKCIIELANGGERDPQKLSDAAVRFLRTNYRA